MVNVLFVQVRSPTGVHGKAASGALHGAMNSPDTSGSTLERSHSNAVTATGESEVSDPSEPS